jgi:hypothetical protein
MATFLHLVKADSAATAISVIEANAQQPGAEVTVVLLGGAVAPALPPAVRVRRLADDDLDHSRLLDLVFGSDHVVTW